MNDFDYLPEGALTYGADPYGPDPWGPDPYGSGPQGPAMWPAARHYAVPQEDFPLRPVNAPPRPQADGRAVRGYPPQGARDGRGYPPPVSGPMPRYQPGMWPPLPDSGPMLAYRPGTSGPMSAYRPDSGAMPAYRPDSGPMPAYRPGMSGPMPAYRPDSGPMSAYRADSGPVPAYRQRGGPPGPRTDPGPGTDAGTGTGYRSAGTSLLSGPPRTSGPMPAYRPKPSAGNSAMSSLQSIGKRAPGWLPFGHRLVILPKEATLGDAEDGELREHRDVNGGWLRPAVFGAMDGLVTNSSLIAGIGGGGGGHGMIVLTGLAGLIAGAFSMATGEYISVNSQNELTAAEVELERKQHARDPEAKRVRLTEVFMEKGVSPNLAEAVVRQISADPDRAVATHVREELGIDPDDLPSPRTAAVASFAAFTVGALIPLAPFLLGFPNLNAALVIAGVSAFVGGAALSKLTGRSPWLGGLRQFTAAFLATGMSFLVGSLVGAHVG
ncbi:MAG: VIT1/CCC1 transporter family protein [Trebonia sp.]